MGKARVGMSKDIELYEQAANILAQSNSKRSSLKTLIYSSKYKNVKQLFAVVHECMKHQSLLSDILSRCPSGLLKEEPLVRGSTELAVVLLYEYLVGKKFGRNEFLRRVFTQYSSEIQDAVNETLSIRGIKTLHEALQAQESATFSNRPRYMRVNLIKSSVKNAVMMLEKEGWSCVGKMSGEKFSKAVSRLKKDQFGVDPFLPDVLIFPSGTDFHDHNLCTEGILIQQDRASCVPAHVLKPVKGSVVLDCCAAPGNKTTHLASLMEDEGEVIGMDKDTKRMHTMSLMVDRSGAQCIRLVNQDFLTVHPSTEDAKRIEMILVDPSCSGSGMRYHPSHQADPPDPERLQALKRFQISILKHALSFPSVQRVVYSTCSINQEENEEVVTEVMSQVSEHFVFEKIFENWKCSRGIETFPEADCFLRLSPETDLTQGFFVACFKRIEEKTSDVEVTTVTKKKRKKVKNIEKANGS